MDVSRVRIHSRDACEEIYTSLKAFVESELGVAPNRNATLEPFLDANLGKTHMSVQLVNMQSVNVSEVSAWLTEWREGTTLYMEPMAGQKTIRYLIDVPILVERREYGRDQSGLGIRKHHHRKRVYKPSGQRALYYAFILLMCVCVLLYKFSMGHTPPLLRVMWNL
jgi:hypothetical protein